MAVMAGGDGFMACCYDISRPATHRPTLSLRWCSLFWFRFVTPHEHASYLVRRPCVAGPTGGGSGTPQDQGRGSLLQGAQGGGSGQQPRVATAGSPDASGTSRDPQAAAAGPQQRSLRVRGQVGQVRRP